MMWPRLPRRVKMARTRRGGRGRRKRKEKGEEREELIEANARTAIDENGLEDACYLQGGRHHIHGGNDGDQVDAKSKGRDGNMEKDRDHECMGARPRNKREREKEQIEQEVAIANPWECDEDQVELMRQYGLPSDFSGSGRKRQMQHTETIVSAVIGLVKGRRYEEQEEKREEKEKEEEEEEGEEDREEFTTELATRTKKRRKWRPNLSEHTIEIESFACLKDLQHRLGMAITHIKWEEGEEEESKSEQVPRQGQRDQDQEREQGTSSGDNGPRQENGHATMVPEQEDGEGVAVKVRALDESSSVDHSAARVLKKFHRQRYDLFHRFDEGIQIDDEGWWSVTPELIAAHTALVLGRSEHPTHTDYHGHEQGQSQGLPPSDDALATTTGLVWDAFAGVGGNTIQFALKGAQHVIATDTNRERLVAASHNAEIYEVRQYIDYIQADALSMSRFWRTSRPSGPHHQGECTAEKGKRSYPRPISPPFKAVFFSPPWGGPAYTQQPVYDLLQMLPINLSVLMTMARTLTREIILYLPRTTSLPQLVSHLLPTDVLRLEWHYLGDRLKVLIVHVQCESTEPKP